MKHTKKILLALSLSAVVIGGGCAAINSEASVSAKNTSESSTEESKLAEKVVRAKTLADFDKILFEDFTFGEAYYGIEVLSDKGGEVELSAYTIDESVVIDEKLFNKYVDEPSLYPLLEHDDLTGSEKERQEFRKTEALTVRVDPWAMMYKFAELIDTEGKTFSQVYEETNMEEFRHYIADKSLKESREYLSKEYGIVEIEGKTKKQLKEAEGLIGDAIFARIETEGKTIEQIKEELLKTNATYRLEQESKDMLYDPNWLIEEDGWWKEVYSPSVSR
ncbi:hypothetical protein [Bacillus solimangrovi]|uniref:Uncharacterized protein n=1 Tax=Bacillus solimangrovi TaxID=1305675 RepID=A0A1E5LB93_9BACI|nr:hypothetical protein [Bacillus solimangrovi]OEH91352.1 hypothetical protein BFG57_05660 [Bacillus solimangrovi]